MARSLSPFSTKLESTDKIFKKLDSGAGMRKPMTASKIKSKARQKKTSHIVFSVGNAFSLQIDRIKRAKKQWIRSSKPPHAPPGWLFWSNIDQKDKAKVASE